jgi:hypothetical protein
MYVSPRQASLQRDVSRPVIKRLVKQGLIGTRRLPGGRIEVNIQDLDRVLVQSTRPARV